MGLFGVRNSFYAYNDPKHLLNPWLNQGIDD